MEASQIAESAFAEATNSFASLPRVIARTICTIPRTTSEMPSTSQSTAAAYSGEKSTTIPAMMLSSA